MAHSAGNTKKASRTRSRAWFFTWNNPPEDYKAQLFDYFSENKLEYVFQLEETSVIHAQGVCRYKNPRDKWPDIDPTIHWERCRSWPKSIKVYCIKRDTRIDGPWTNIKGIAWRKTLIDPLRGKELYPFQKEILEICKTDPDFRKINWYWESNGCAGKTSLARHLMIKYGKEAIYLNGTNKDCMCLLFKRFEDNIDVKYVFFNLSRQDQNACSYKTLEILKDGVGFSGKYESSCDVWNPPHVFVFANFKPDLDKLSNDRWIIHKII